MIMTMVLVVWWAEPVGQKQTVLVIGPYCGEKSTPQVTLHWPSVAQEVL